MSYLMDKIEGHTVLLLTMTGSRLYGVHTPESDYDYWAVVLENVKTSQKVVEGEDVTLISLKNFMTMLDNGVPQAMEVLWSPVAEFNETYKPLLNSLSPHLWWARYRLLAPQSLEKMKKKGQPLTPKQWRKGKMQKTRLALQWYNMAHNGWFNPQLSGEQLEIVLYAGTEEGNWVPEVVHTMAVNTLPDYAR